MALELGLVQHSQERFARLGTVAFPGGNLGIYRHFLSWLKYCS